MTALVAIENSSLDEMVTFSKEAVYSTEGSSIARDVGEEMTMEQCLYGMLLESANECAYAIGEHVAGSEEAFVQMMNEKASELGCVNTHFNNTNGLPDEEHYTTAYDMALISRAAYDNETFRVICGTGHYEIAPTNKHSDVTYLRNHHSMLYPLKTDKYLYDGCTGGKTGYTTVANSTLVTYAQRNSMTLICVIMNADSPDHYTDTATLFDWGFENFRVWNISENETKFSDPQESFFDTDAEVFETDESMISIDESAEVILPVNGDFSGTKGQMIHDEETGESYMQYTYGDKIVGKAALTMENLAAKTFDMPSDRAAASSDVSNESNRPIEIPLTTVLIGIVVAAGVVVLIVVIVYISRNFYIIRHKFETHRAAGSSNVMSRRELRRMKKEQRRERKRLKKW